MRGATIAEVDAAWPGGGCWAVLSMRRVQVYRHSLEPGAQPECIFEEKDEKYYVTISKTADKQLILIHAAASMQNEIRFLRSDTPGGDFQVWPSRARSACASASSN